jgi:hypothetical protein
MTIQRSKYEWAIELLRQHLEGVADRRKEAQSKLNEAAHMIEGANMKLEMCNAQETEINAAITALKAAEKREVLGHPKPDAEWHPTHKVETSVRQDLRSDFLSTTGDRVLGVPYEVTYCTECGAGDPNVEEQHKKTDPCVKARAIVAQSAKVKNLLKGDPGLPSCIQDDFGPVQPL